MTNHGFSGVLLTCVLATAASAAPILAYNFDAATGAPSSFATGVTGNTIASGGANLQLDYNPVTPAYPTPVLRTVPAVVSSTTEAAAFTNNAFWTFTLTPTVGSVASLTSLTFDAGRGGASTPRSWFLYDSVTGFTSGNNIGSAAVATVRPTFTSYSVDLSAAKYQNLSAPITFRFYVVTPGTSLSLEFDNVVVNGTVTPVPEPSHVLAAA